MTDARIPERYLSDRRVLRLSPTEFQAWVFATLWSVSNRTDGVIEREEVLLIPFMTDEIALTLVKRDLWSATDAGWLISDFEQNQTSRHDLEVLENVRRAGRDKKARQRASRGGAADDAAPRFADVPGDSTGGTYPGTYRGRVPGEDTGQAGRTGRDQETWFVNENTGEVTDVSLPLPDSTDSSLPDSSDISPRPVSTWEVAPIGRGLLCRVPSCGRSVEDYPESMHGVCEIQDAAHAQQRAASAA